MVIEYLLKTKRDRGAGYLLLIDPDKINKGEFPGFIKEASSSGVDAFLVGGSLMLTNEFEATLKTIKENTKTPVIIFPGSVSQVSSIADAILFLILISGRNPDHLIGNQVVAAPIIKRAGLEAISTGYMLIDGGNVTSAEFMSNTKPIPREKTDIAVAHALAAELIGLKLLYLEAGSGAKQSVPDEMINKIAQHCSLPVIAGGGICTPEEARNKIKAGASFIVTGTVIEQNSDSKVIKEFAQAIHKS
ncbi:MAG: geranylgeranylglyceryl/heptaprenylglyceryl phosphate synthase [Bacteroidetes bacterium]|nr:geranylgeranylglyceryl/heptaprenylglyceryl phosphate synthase [Bacteroidota bacterium]